MNVEQRIAASPERIWAALNDVNMLKACIPGCESLEVTGDNTFAAKVVTKIGPVKAKFEFVVTLTNLNPPTSYTINAKGQGGAAGFANGSADVSLRPDGNETILAYQAKAQIGGKLAQLGSRLVDATAAKLAGEFFDTLNMMLSKEQLDRSQPGVPEHARVNLLPVWVSLLLLGLVAMAGLLFALSR
ncbi:MAG: carbon monoxide dehydrogenase subunit G [Pseudohongiellaceae bacterium]